MLKRILLTILFFTLMQCENDGGKTKSYGALKEGLSSDVQAERLNYLTFISFSVWIDKFELSQGSGVATTAKDRGTDSEEYVNYMEDRLTVSEAIEKVRSFEHFNIKSYVESEKLKLDEWVLAIESEDTETLMSLLDKDTLELYEIIRTILSLSVEGGDSYAPTTDDVLANAIYSVVNSGDEKIKAKTLRLFGGFYMALFDYALENEEIKQAEGDDRYQKMTDYLAALRDGKLEEQRAAYSQQLQTIYKSKMETAESRTELTARAKEHIETLNQLSTLLADGVTQTEIDAAPAFAVRGLLAFAASWANKETPISLVEEKPNLVSSVSGSVNLTINNSIPSQSSLGYDEGGGWSCGLRSATVILNYLGSNVTYEYMRSVRVKESFFGSYKFGTSTGMLVSVINDHLQNGKVTDADMDFDDALALIQQKNTPIIILVQNGDQMWHWEVVHGYDIYGSSPSDTDELKISESGNYKDEYGPTKSEYEWERGGSLSWLVRLTGTTSETVVYLQ